MRTAAFALATLLAVPAFAADPSITVSQPWLRATPKAVPVALAVNPEIDAVTVGVVPREARGQVTLAVEAQRLVDADHPARGDPRRIRLVERPGGD